MSKKIYNCLQTCEIKLSLIMRKKNHDLSQEEYDRFLEILTTNSTKEAAKILGISRRSVYNYMDDLGIKPLKSKLKSALLKSK